MNCHGDLSPCNNDSELGRSLTEMLGTLAIMGILTIGGIAGFNYAMDKSKANDILDGINKRAIALSTYTLLGTNITASSLSAEFPNKIGDSTVAVAAEGDGFNLTVSGVSDSVCDKVLDTGLKMASKISLGETMVWNGSAKSDHACAEENTITFAFNAALDNTMTCGYCQHTENNTCVADETCDNGCPGNKPLRINDGSCWECDSPFVFRADAAECAKCSERKMQNGGCIMKECPEGQLQTSGGHCRNCSEGEPLVTDATECAKCPERKMVNWKCAKICPEGQFINSDGYCKSCSNSNPIVADATECATCSNRYMTTTYGYCASCSDYSVYTADATECAKCSNHVMYDGKCAPICLEGQLRIKIGYCKNCSSSEPLEADVTECAKCSERKMQNGVCIMKECPEGQFQTRDGHCRKCDFPFAIDTDAAECAKCPNREMQGNECVLK